MKIFLAASPPSTLVLSSYSKTWFGIRIKCLSGMTFLTKKISQFLFLGVEDIRQDKKKSMCIFPEKIYSQHFTTVQTLFLSIIPRFYYISILKLIYIYCSAPGVELLTSELQECSNSPNYLLPKYLLSRQSKPSYQQITINYYHGNDKSAMMTMTMYLAYED